MFRESLKWVTLGGLTATVLSVGIFLQVPVNANLEEPKILAEDADYSRSLYGVPAFEMDHYKLSGDDYFNYIMSGGLSVGRDNPSGFTGWYSMLLNNPELLSENSELRSKINVALGDAKFNELKEALEKAEAEKLIKEQEEKERLEREKEEAKKAKELEEEESLSESDVNVDVKDEVDEKDENIKDSFADLDSVGYTNVLIEEYNSFNKSVKALGSEFDSKKWVELKKRTENFNKEFSSSVSSNISKLSEDSSEKIVKDITELNRLMATYVSAYDSKYESGKDSGEIKTVKDKIETLVSSIKKELK